MESSGGKTPPVKETLTTDEAKVRDSLLQRAVRSRWARGILTVLAMLPGTVGHNLPTSSPADFDDQRRAAAKVMPTEPVPTPELVPVLGPDEKFFAETLAKYINFSADPKWMELYKKMLVALSDQNPKKSQQFIINEGGTLAPDKSNPATVQDAYSYQCPDFQFILFLQRIGEKGPLTQKTIKFPILPFTGTMEDPNQEMPAAAKKFLVIQPFSWSKPTALGVIEGTAVDTGSEIIKTSLQAPPNLSSIIVYKR